MSSIVGDVISQTGGQASDMCLTYTKWKRNVARLNFIIPGFEIVLILHYSDHILQRIVRIEPTNSVFESLPIWIIALSRTVVNGGRLGRKRERRKRHDCEDSPKVNKIINASFVVY